MGNLEWGDQRIERVCLKVSSSISGPQQALDFVHKDVRKTIYMDPLRGFDLLHCLY